MKAYLVTYDFSLKSTEDYLRRFARSLCQNFAALQEKGHPKWREVELALPDLGRGWLYYPPSSGELRACMAAKAKPKARAGKDVLAAGADPGLVQVARRVPNRARCREARRRPIQLQSRSRCREMLRSWVTASRSRYPARTS